MDKYVLIKICAAGGYLCGTVNACHDKWMKVLYWKLIYIIYTLFAIFHLNRHTLPC